MSNEIKLKQGIVKRKITVGDIEVDDNNYALILAIDALIEQLEQLRLSGLRK